jgi:cytochrome c biogenesis protein CcdA
MQREAVDVATPTQAAVERRGRRFIFGSFVLCPCHLPITLGVLAAVLGGTALGTFLRANMVLAGVVITAAWLAGTARGFMLVRMARRGSCPVGSTGR